MPRFRAHYRACSVDSPNCRRVSYARDAHVSSGPTSARVTRWSVSVGAGQPRGRGTPPEGSVWEECRCASPSRPLECRRLVIGPPPPLLFACIVGPGQKGRLPRPYAVGRETRTKLRSRSRFRSRFQKGSILESTSGSILISAEGSRFKSVSPFPSFSPSPGLPQGYYGLC